MSAGRQRPVSGGVDTRRLTFDADREQFRDSVRRFFQQEIAPPVEAQRERFLPKAISGEHILAIAMTEPGADSDLAGMRARAEPAPGGDGWILNGAKTYISNGLQADLGDPTRGLQHMARLLARERLSLAMPRWRMPRLPST